MGLLYPLRLSFLVSRLFLLVTSWGIHLPPLTTQTSVAIAALRVLFLLSTTLCWPCSSDLCFPFSFSWASVPWACSCGVLFSGSVGVPLTCYVAPFSGLWGFSGFRLCSFCRSAASPCVAYSCRFSLLLSLLLVSLPCWRLLWFAPPRCLQCLL